MRLWSPPPPRCRRGSAGPGEAGRERAPASWRLSIAVLLSRDRVSGSIWFATVADSSSSTRPSIGSANAAACSSSSLRSFASDFTNQSGRSSRAAGRAGRGRAARRSLPVAANVRPGAGVEGARSQSFGGERPSRGRRRARRRRLRRAGDPPADAAAARFAWRGRGVLRLRRCAAASSR